MYWGVFVVGIALILFNRIEWEKEPDPVGWRAAEGGCFGGRPAGRAAAGQRRQQRPAGGGQGSGQAQRGQQRQGRTFAGGQQQAGCRRGRRSHTPLMQPAGPALASPPQAIEERRRAREAARLEAARLVLAGKSILVPWGTDDPFVGMTPQVCLSCGWVVGEMLLGAASWLRRRKPQLAHPLPAPCWPAAALRGCPQGCRAAPRRSAPQPLLCCSHASASLRPAQEIEAFCRSATGGATEADPFEGLSPQEIDEYIARHGLPATAGP